MATVTSLCEPILAKIANLPEPTAKQAWIYAARKFFTQTMAWRENVEETSVADQELYLLDPGTGLEVFDANPVAYYGTDKLTKATKAKLNQLTALNYTTQPELFRVVTPNNLEIFPTPGDAGVTIKILGYIRPLLTATDIDGAIASKFGDIIMLGALGELYRVPKEDWSDYDLSRDYRAEFQAEIDRHWALGPDDGQVGVARQVSYGGIK